MRPVDSKFKDTQQFGSGATQGVKANSNPNSGMGYYVWLYGNYQPLGHAGLDIGCPIGTPIYAPADGTVLYAGWVEDLPGNGPIRKWLLYYNFGGIATVTQHNGWISIIAHQSNNDYVKAGQQVKEGQLIGLSGNTMTRKTTLAPHVHVEALVDVTYRSTGGLIYGRTDPQKFFGGIAAQGTITPLSEEDDMPYTPDQIRQFAAEGVDSWAKGQRVFPDNRNLIDQLIQMRSEVGAAIRAADAVPNTVLFSTRIDGRNLFDWLKQLRAEISGIKPGSVDVAALAKSIVDQLPKADVAALAAQLQITVKGQ